MRARARGFLALFVLAVGLGLAGCDTVDRLQDSVTGLLDRKKKLPGERQSVFPEGVPGVVQGVPPEYLKENKPQESDPTELATPREPEKPAPEARSAPHQRPERTPKPADADEPDAAEAPKEKPAAKPQRPPRQTAQQPRKPAIPPAEPVNPAPASAAPAAPAATAPQTFPAPQGNAPLPWPTAPR